MKFSRRHGLKVTAALTLGSSFSLLSGCQSEAGAQSNLIRMGVTSRPRMLDPRKATDALSSRINRLLYQALIDFDDAFQPIPSLATWQQFSDLHYRFTLQKKTYFHHGKPLTAEDVAATYQAILDEAFASPLRGSLKNIAHIQAVNAQQVDFKLKQPDALFVGRLNVGICPADLIAQHHRFQDHPIGSGAAKFVAMDAQQLTLQRLTDGVQLQFIPVKDATVRVLKLRKGELDLIQNDLSPEMVAYCQQRSDLKVQWHNGTNFAYLGFNFEDPVLALPEIRQAIAYGIDRSAIIHAMFQGHARLAGGLLVPNHWAGNPDLTGYPYQPQLAQTKLQQGIAKLENQAQKQSKKMAKSAHFPSPASQDNDLLTASLAKWGVKMDEIGEKRLQLSYKTSSNPTRIRLATIYQSQLRKIGIDLKIQSYDWGTFYHDIKQGRFQLYSLAWVGIKSPDIFKYVFDSSAIPPNGANRGRYRDPVADQLIRQAEKEQDLKKAAALYRQLQAHLQQTLACLPLWYEDQYAVMRQNLSDYPLYADGRYDGLLSIKKI